MAIDEKRKDNYKVGNAVIMAAGLSSRFAPLSYEYPKALLKVKGEILIERQIRQLKEAGILDITIVVGYKKEFFYYLKDKYQVKIVENPDYNLRNNNSSIYHVREILSNTYICSADNYFKENIFESHVDRSYYSTVFQQGKTDEWCIYTDESGLITDVQVGGKDSWVMLGHAFFSEEFSNKFVKILENVYNLPETFSLFWENIYINNIGELPMYIRKYSKETIFEFDTLDELRKFDESYYKNTGSKILMQLAKKLECDESDIVSAEPMIEDGEIIGFIFTINDKRYKYNYLTKVISIKEGLI